MPRGNAVAESTSPGATAPVVRMFTSPENGKSVKSAEARPAADPTARPNTEPSATRSSFPPVKTLMGAESFRMLRLI
jgi:hypothetical protein